MQYDLNLINLGLWHQFHIGGLEHFCHQNTIGIHYVKYEHPSLDIVSGFSVTCHKTDDKFFDICIDFKAIYAMRDLR